MKLFLIVACTISAIFAQSTSNGPCAGKPLGSYAPNPASCTSYYQCVSNNSILMPCANGTEFNAALNVCDWPLRAKCSTGSSTGASGNPDTSGDTGSNTGSSDNTGNSDLNNSNNNNENDSGVPINDSPSRATSPCTSNNPATFPKDSDCTQYIYCYQGYPYTVQCPSGQYFNAQSNNCITAASCPQGGGGVTAAPSTQSPPTGNINCPSTGAATYPYPDDNSKYYYCYNGQAYLVQCAANEQYNAASKACSSINTTS